MIRYKLKELLKERSRQRGKRLPIQTVADAIGVDRTTLSKLVNDRNYATTTTVLDKLCSYFETDIASVIEYVPDQADSDLTGD